MKMLRKNSVAHQRRFGVEIECGLLGGTEAAAKLFSFPFTSGYHDYQNEEGWMLDADGSGVELKTPPLSGKSGFQTVRRAMEVLKDAGAYVTYRDGLHIHHDAPEFIADPKNCLILVESWRNNIVEIHDMVAPRRRGSGACPAWDNTRFEYLRQWAEGLSSSAQLSRNDLNLSALHEHGTIEIRLHEGTLDPDAAIAWIQFGQLFIHEVLKQAKALSPRTASSEELLSRLSLSPDAKKIVMAKKAANHITPASRYQ